MFDRVAEMPHGRHPFQVGPALAREVGYPDEILGSWPGTAVESFTGLADLHPHLRLQRGERVLDLGCGSGLDVVIAARAVGPEGSVTGVDASDAMVDKARALAARLGAGRVRIERAAAEALPFPDSTFDAALVNGLLNLCPDKAAVVPELHRVLRRRGRAAVAEITFARPLPPQEPSTARDWFR
jgi:ubiquinone/menaquinone biosynthesis C-methylase UbiE